MMNRKLILLIAVLSVAALSIGCAGMSDLVRAEGESKNASYVFETRFTGVKLGFEQPVEGNIPLPVVKFGKADNVFGIIAPGKEDGMRYRNRRNIILEATAEGGPGAAALSGDETIIAIDKMEYLGTIPPAPVVGETQ